jgi:hypothetical protein
MTGAAREIARLSDNRIVGSVWFLRPDDVDATGSSGQAGQNAIVPALCRGSAQVVNGNQPSRRAPRMTCDAVAELVADRVDEALLTH